LHKEAALKRYKISVSYENHAFEEIMELYAKDLEDAVNKCESIKAQNMDLVERLCRSNVFVSKVIKKVKVSPDNI
jgi:hypothetical protein